MRIKSLLLPFALLFLGSCASMMTMNEQYREMDDLLIRRDFVQASAIIETAKEDKLYQEKDKVLYYLDIGMLNYYNEAYTESIENLTSAEYAIEELYTKSVGKAIASGLLNDNALDYFGEDYEDIYLNLFKALSFITLKNHDEAMVELRRVNIKLNLLEDKYRQMLNDYNNSGEAEAELQPLESRFHNDVLARYLSLLLFRDDNDYDGARIDGEKITDAFEQQTHLYQFEAPKIPALEYADRTLLNLVAFSGRSPAKLAHTIYIDSGYSIVYLTYAGEDDSYVNRLIGFHTIIMPGVQPGFHFKFELPYLSKRGSDVTSVKVLVDGVNAGELQLTENMELIAEETFKLKQPLIVGKTVARTVTKGIVKELSKSAVNEASGGGIAGLLAGLVMDVAVDATENADTRLSQFFPAFAYTGELEVTPGQHEIELIYYSGSSAVFRDNKGIVDVKTNSLNLVQSFVFQ